VQGEQTTSAEVVRTILMSVLVWTVVGVPVACVISGFVLSVFVILEVPRMVACAAIFGLAQGSCLLLASVLHPDGGRSRGTKSSGLRWFGAAWGASLGLLGFPAIFCKTDGSIGIPVLVLFITAGMIGGAVAGFTCYRILPETLSKPPGLFRGFVIAGLIASAVAVADYEFFWDATMERLPVPGISDRMMSNLTAGTAIGENRSGCYYYQGSESIGSGAQASEGGLVSVKQENGTLQISNSYHATWRGGIDRNGDFRAGSREIQGSSEVRTLWEGKFSDNSFTFTKRLTALDNGKPGHSIKIEGNAWRSMCK